MFIEQQYRLPLEAIIEVIRGSLDLVSVQATLPALPLLAKESCRAEPLIGPGTQGPLYSCAILTQEDHLLLQQQEASTLLRHLGDVTWSVRPATSPDDTIAPAEHCFDPQHTPPLFSNLLSVPVRSVVPVSPSQMQSLTHPHTRVCALADGTDRASPDEIATRDPIHRACATNNAWYQALTIFYSFLKRSNIV